MIKVRNNLFQGSLDDLNIETLRINKITHVIVAAKELDCILPDYICWNDRLQECTHFIHYNLVDDATDQKELINEILCDLNGFLREIDSKILVICAAGLSRSPYIIARYLSKKDGKSLDIIYRELKILNNAIDENTQMKCN